MTPDDVKRYGLKAPAGFNVPGVNVTAEDKERYGLNPMPKDGRKFEVEVTDEDKARYGLNPVTVAAGDNGVKVTDEDKERYGLNPVQVAAGDGAISVSEVRAQHGWESAAREGYHPACMRTWSGRADSGRLRAGGQDPARAGGAGGGRQGRGRGGDERRRRAVRARGAAGVAPARGGQRDGG